MILFCKNSVYYIRFTVKEHGLVRFSNSIYLLNRNSPEILNWRNDRLKSVPLWAPRTWRASAATFCLLWTCYEAEGVLGSVLGVTCYNAANWWKAMTLLFNYYLYEELVKPSEQLTDRWNKKTIRDSAPASATNFANHWCSLANGRQLQLPEHQEAVPFAKHRLLFVSLHPSGQKQSRRRTKGPVNSNNEKWGENGLECNIRSMKVVWNLQPNSWIGPIS